MLRNKNFFLFSLCLISAFSVHASPQEHIVVAPKCLIEQRDATYQTLSTTKNLLLIKTDDTGIDELTHAKHQQKNACGGFIDVTDPWNELNKKSQLTANLNKTFLSNYETPTKTLRSNNQTEYRIAYEKEVKPLLKTVNTDEMFSHLGTLTNFENRYANSKLGEKAAEWFKENILATARKYGHTSLMDNDFTVYTVKTGDHYSQDSVVAKFGNGTGPAIVIGAHMDTPNGRKPGADDDGSGSVTLFEAARTLLASGMHFEQPIYFIWYAAEEVGLVGSSFVVKHFQSEKIPVAAVMQLDLTGYDHQKETTMWLMTDYTNKELTSYLEKLITTYIKRPVKYSRCGYACSDHANWHRNGFVAALPAEAAYENTNPYIHSINDTIDKLSRDHMTDYAKLAVAFAVELAKPVKA